MSLSRIELNEHTRPSRAVDVRRAIVSVIEGLEPKARARDVAVGLEAPNDLPAARGEPDELTQVFQNLIENAVKYTLPGTAVTVAVSALERGPTRNNFV